MFRKDRLVELALELTGIVFAVLLALGLGFVITYFLSEDPGKAYHALLVKPFVGYFNFGNLIERMIPLVFTGLSVAVAFKTRLFSMGAEGQLYMGALAGTLVALFVPVPTPWLHIPLILLAAIVAGGLYGAIPGALKAYTGANEIVSTLMLNPLAILLVSYLVSNPLRDLNSGYSQTKYIPETAQLLRFMPPSRVHMGLLIALVAVAFTYFFLYRTTKGYELRMVGHNPDFAEYGGIDKRKVMTLSLVVSGALAGLGGIVEVTGIHWRLIESFSPGYGFDGIVVALLARNHPLAVPFAAFFYAYLKTGAVIMERSSDISRELVSIIQAVMILFITAQAIFSVIKRRARRRAENA